MKVILDNGAYMPEIVDRFEDTERGSNGFGSTGR